MDIIDVQKGIEDCIEYFENNHEQLAKLKAKFEGMKEYQKTSLALCELASTGSTESEIKRRGLAHNDHTTFLLEFKKARIAHLKKQAEYDFQKAKFEGLRSLNKNIA